jgi:hypothetical protein
MNFIKYTPLKQKLRERTLTDREALPYLIVFTALTALMVGVPLYENYNAMDGISAACSVALAIFGIIFAYKQNGKENGYDLVQKYVVLGWITSIRFILVGIPLYIVVAIAGYSMGFSMEETNGIDLVFSVGFEALLYYRIAMHIRDTREAIQTA